MKLLSDNQIQPVLDRKTLAKFQENLQNFLMNVRGFLRVK